MTREFLERLAKWYPSFNTTLQPLLDSAAVEAQCNAQDAGIDLPDEFPLRSKDDVPLSPATGKDKDRVSRDAAGQPPLRDPAGMSDAWTQIYALQIPLPSSYDTRVLSCNIVAGAVQRERQFRESEANDALNEVRTHLVTTEVVKMRGFATKSKGASARAREKMSETHKDVDRAANRYQRARLALIALGKSSDDPVYRPL